MMLIKSLSLSNGYNGAQRLSVSMFFPGSTEKQAIRDFLASTVSQGKTIALNKRGGQSKTTIQWRID